MFFYIRISSKDKESLKRFLEFISGLKSLNLLISHFPKHQIKKFITVLKSPHVNKSAQEQFEYRIFTKKLLVNSPQALKFFSIIKKVKNVSFPGIDLKIEGVFEKKKEFKNLLHCMNPDNLDIDFFQTASQRSHPKITKYVQVLDSYGEYSVKILRQIQKI
jgi:ribosomal protein S10